MTRKHFVKLAEYIAKIQDRQTRALAALAVARACKEFNPNFCFVKFAAACGLTIFDLAQAADHLPED